MIINVSNNLRLLMRLRTCLFAILLFAERKQTPRKQKNHRAMDDIRESIAELKYYKDNIFNHKNLRNSNMDEVSLHLRVGD
jgi:uncharacterized protein YchJ